MEDTEKIQKEYEIGVLVRREEDLATVKSFMERHRAACAADFQAKKIALAYPIKKETDAFFAFCRFSAEPADVKQLERDLLTEPTVLRSLILVPFKMSHREAVGLSKKHSKSRSHPASVATPAPSSAPFVQTLSNEALEKKIEEMLK
jgi:ribosomal protein S6